MENASDTVMVIEDDDEARGFLIEILAFEGIHAIGFPNGDEALRYLESAKLPSLIVLDILMPVMNGWQFRSAMLKDSQLAKIPVVVVTALDTDRTLGIDAVKILRKPLDVDQLLQVVRAYS
jgi:CheY-like chemotaxis protein